MHYYSFEKLDVWRLSRELTADIYRLTKAFPKDEMFGLSSQIRRASISVASNIAEGTSRTSGKDKAHFSVIAYSSLMEVLNQVIIACDLEYISQEDSDSLRIKVNEISNKLIALKNAQMKM